MFLRQHQRRKDGKEHSYWSLVETVRTSDGPRQHTLCYLGELNHSAHARWQKTVEVFNEQGEYTRRRRAQAPLTPSRATIFEGQQPDAYSRMFAHTPFVTNNLGRTAAGCGYVIEAGTT